MIRFSADLHFYAFYFQFVLGGSGYRIGSPYRTTPRVNGTGSRYLSQIFSSIQKPLSTGDHRHDRLVHLSRQIRDSRA